MNSDIENVKFIISMQNSTFLNYTKLNKIYGYKLGQKIESNSTYTYSSGGVAVGTTAGKIAGRALQIMTLLAFLISIKIAFTLLKLFQMLEFLALFNITYPENVRSFLEIFSVSYPISLIPNPFSFLQVFNDICAEDEANQYINEEVECQVLKKSGTIISLFILY